MEDDLIDGAFVAGQVVQLLSRGRVPDMHNSEEYKLLHLDMLQHPRQPDTHSVAHNIPVRRATSNLLTAIRTNGGPITAEQQLLRSMSSPVKARLESLRLVRHEGPDIPLEQTALHAVRQEVSARRTQTEACDGVGVAP